MKMWLQLTLESWIISPLMLHNNNKLSFDAIGRKTRWPMSMAKVNAHLSSAITLNLKGSREGAPRERDYYGLCLHVHAAFVHSISMLSRNHKTWSHETPISGVSESASGWFNRLCELWLKTFLKSCPYLLYKVYSIQRNIF